MDEYAVYYPVLMVFSQRNSPASESGQRIFSVSPATAGNRLDRWLAECLPAVSRSRIQAVIRSGGVLVNGARAKASHIVRTDDEIVWREPAVTPCESARAEEMPLEILFEDDVVAVLNKPAGVVVHPGAGHRGGTLVSGLLHHFARLSNVGGVERPGIIHRLDKETSGCLVVAKTDPAHRALAAQFASREVVKIYLALVAGSPRFRVGIVNAPITRDPLHRKKMRVTLTGRGREAITEYRVIATAGGKSLIECRPRTGRTHQIRVHLKHLGCPVLGDPLYGRRANFSRHMLHAWQLQFRHPLSGERLTFEATPPAEFRIT
ncbi:MAG TPA: RluA family pseudouridine synthase [Terrimicrobiaceae bacterium]|nr:RluA family pseudouridine synthase [Terrimicrobiaceae bacterium]